MLIRTDLTVMAEDIVERISRLGLCDESSTDDVLTVSPYSTDPQRAWKELHKQLKINQVIPLPLNTPVRDDAVRFVCISDTHDKLKNLIKEPRQAQDKKGIPPGDVLLHAGDFTFLGSAGRVQKFNEILGTLPHQHKVVIAGNHELSFDDNCEKMITGTMASQNKSILREAGVSAVKDLLTNCIYLEDSSVEIYGIKIYGSPWQPAYHGWAFNAPRGRALMEIWNKIPSDTDVLMTHGPPLGYGDLLKSSQRAGCVDLLNTVQKRVRPLYHVFGHIHEGYGVFSDGHTTYINAATCTTKYFPSNPPVIFDIGLPEGLTKTS